MKLQVGLLLTTLLAVASAAEEAKLRIGVLRKVEGCTRKARSGDLVEVHYTGKLEDGTVFDSSIERGKPIEFPLGVGRVIQGWDQGILGMCVGEKRKLTIPPHLGYGDSGAGAVIPPHATLVFLTELVSINGEGAPVVEETVVEVPDLDYDSKTEDEDSDDEVDVHKRKEHVKIVEQESDVESESSSSHGESDTDATEFSDDESHIKDKLDL